MNVPRPTIEVLYTCNQCGLTDVHVMVFSRMAEDVSVWLMEVAAPALAHDHEQRSPHCRITKFTNIKIPIPAGTSKIGGTVEN